MPPLRVEFWTSKGRKGKRLCTEPHSTRRTIGRRCQELADEHGCIVNANPALDKKNLQHPWIARGRNPQIGTLCWAVPKQPRKQPEPRPL